MGDEENKKRGTKTVYVIDHVKPLCALVQPEEGRRNISSPKPGRLTGTLSSPLRIIADHGHVAGGVMSAAANPRDPPPIDPSDSQRLASMDYPERNYRNWHRRPYSA